MPSEDLQSVLNLHPMLASIKHLQDVLDLFVQQFIAQLGLVELLVPPLLMAVVLLHLLMVLEPEVLSKIPLV